MKIMQLSVKSFLRLYIVPLFATIVIAVFAWNYRYDISIWWIIFIVAALIGHYYFYFRGQKKEDR